MRDQLPNELGGSVPDRREQQMQAGRSDAAWIRAESPAQRKWGEQQESEWGHLKDLVDCDLEFGFLLDCQ